VRGLDQDLVLRQEMTGGVESGDGRAPWCYAEDEQRSRAGGPHLGHLRVGDEDVGGGAAEADNTTATGLQRQRTAQCGRRCSQ
jgi:hypothetical protein